MCHRSRFRWHMKAAASAIGSGCIFLAYSKFGVIQGWRTETLFRTNNCHGNTLFRMNSVFFP